MAKFISTTPPAEPVHTFELSQRDIDLLTSILFDILVSGAELYIPGESEAYVPRKDTRKDLAELADVLNEVGMSIHNDYLSNFRPVSNGD